MCYRILETDEVLNDLDSIAKNIYEYTLDIESGNKFLDTYDIIVERLKTFRLSIEV